MTNVFRQPVDLAEINRLSANSAIGHLGIVYTEAGDDYLRATMPVDARTLQPFGILHGGLTFERFVIGAYRLGQTPRFCQRITSIVMAIGAINSLQRFQ